MNTIFTIGHSTLSIEDFLARLKSFNIKTLVDVRSYPGSRRNPQYNKNKLLQSLAENAIDYIHLPALGGKREPVNTPGGKHHVFQGYLDHMNSEEFIIGIEELGRIIKSSTAAIMCAEGDWRKCHRSLIADHLKYQSMDLEHILDIDTREEHTYTKLFMESQPGLEFID